MTLRMRMLLCGTGAAAVIAVCFFPFSRERAVRALLDKERVAIQEKNIDKTLSCVSMFYKDDLGLTYATLRGCFDMVFKEYRDIRIDYTVSGITFGKDTCIVDIMLWARAAWAGAERDLVGSQNGPEPMTIFCSKGFLKWKVVGARWPPEIRPAAGL